MSEKSGKKKRRKEVGEASQLAKPAEIEPREPATEPAERIQSLPAMAAQEHDNGPLTTEPAPATATEPSTRHKPPQVPTMSLVDYTDEERSRDPTPEESTPAEPITAGRSGLGSSGNIADSYRAKPEQVASGDGQINS